jgi:photosystem II stability/assembly factor-like uncharacterized protein
MTIRRIAILAAPVAAALTLYGLRAGGQTQKPVAATGSGSWRSAVGNLAEGKWGDFGLHHAVSVPGRREIIAGVSGRGLFASSDGGVTWKKLGAEGDLNGRPQQVTFDPDNPNIFWATCIYGSNIYRTRDGGATFEVIKPGGGETISVDFTDPDRRTLLTASHELGNTLMLSVTSGRTWHSLAENIPPGLSLQPNAFLYGDTIIACSTSASRPGIFRSTDSGRNWTQVSTSVAGWRAPRFGKKPGQIYWAGSVRGFIRSDDGGKTWASLGGPIMGAPTELEDGTLVGFGEKSLFRSSDIGVTWRPFGPPFPFVPWGMFYNERLHTYFIFHFTGTGDRTALMKWTP